MSAHNDSTVHETSFTTFGDDVGKKDGDYGSIDRTAPTPGRPRYVAVEVVGLLYFTNTYYLIYHQQFYLRERAKLEYDVNHLSESLMNNSTDRENTIQAKATTDLILITLCLILPASLTTLLVGGLSDVFGRKMLMYLSLTGAMIYCINMIIVVRYSLSVYFLCIGAVLHGLGGYFATMMTALFSTVADITEPGDRRSWRMILLSFILFLASALGASISGIWIDRAGYLQPLYLSIALCIASLFVVIIFIPETHQAAKSKHVLKENLSIIKQGFNFYFAPSKTRTLVGLCLMTFITSFSVGFTKQMILNLFLLTSPFFWSTTHITLYSALRVLLSWFVILLTTGCLRRVMSAISLTLVGVLSNIVSLVLIATSTNDPMIYIAGVAGVYAQATGPLMRGFMSSLASPDQQGAVFCVLDLSEMVSTAVFTVAGGLIYAATLAIFPGFVFIALALILLFVAVALFIAKRLQDREGDGSID
ncbi:proton-coupled folate transporter-like [Haliotis cracherodii]|uniref:proton-coupled folate transporter-like n=1 Tax=Haliotis cracherodii TaxID=6455 RepID=UPI0039E7B397